MKSGILVIDKDKDMTSRDVVNAVCGKLGTKKVGHTGTLDPIATGVLVLCVNEGTKVIEFLTSDSKEYIASSKIGIETDTLDITGNILKRGNVNISTNQLKEVLNSFVGSYMQEVPKYSAVRVDGKRLYDYARCDIDVLLPKRMVDIKSIELLDYNGDEFTFKVHVSKGTYIRSLIRDIGRSLGTYCTMTELRRVKQGIFNIEVSIKLDDVSYDKLISINESLKDYPYIKVDDDTLKKVKNGAKINGNVEGIVKIIDSNNNLLALYKNDSNNNLLRSVRVFNGEDYEKIK